MRNFVRPVRLFNSSVNGRVIRLLLDRLLSCDPSFPKKRLDDALVNVSEDVNSRVKERQKLLFAVQECSKHGAILLRTKICAVILRNAIDTCHALLGQRHIIKALIGLLKTDEEEQCILYILMTLSRLASSSGLWSPLFNQGNP